MKLLPLELNLASTHIGNTVSDTPKLTRAASI
jgi:hypothetical protein